MASGYIVGIPRHHTPTVKEEKELLFPVGGGTI